MCCITGCIQNEGGCISVESVYDILFVGNDCMDCSVLHSEGMLPLRGFIAVEEYVACLVSGGCSDGVFGQ